MKRRMATRLEDIDDQPTMIQNIAGFTFCLLCLLPFLYSLLVTLGVVR